MNKKQMVRLTESDLQNIIKESVMQILKENPQNEGLWDYFKSMGRQGGNKAQAMGQQVGQQAKQQYNNMAGKAQQGWNAVKGAAQRGYDAASQKVGQGVDAVRGAAQRGYDAAAQKVGQGVDAVRGAYNNAAQGVKTMHQNAMQDSSMANMKSSMDKFEKDLQVYLKNGGQVDRQLKSRLSGIMNMLNNYQQHA